MSTASRPTSTSDRVIAVIEDHEDPVVSAPEIAEELGMTRQAINYRLQQLAEEGVVKRKRIGSRAVAWWVA